MCFAGAGRVSNLGAPSKSSRCAAGLARRFPAALQPVRSSGSYLFERGVELYEQIPTILLKGRRDGVDHQLLELLVPNALPKFVGERNEQLFEGRFHRRPARVREAHARERCRNPVFEKQALPRGLVVGARGLELSGMQDLAGIMQHDADANELGVVRNPKIRESGQQQLPRFADQGNVAEQPRRRTQTFEQRSSRSNGLWIG